MGWDLYVRNQFDEWELANTQVPFVYNATARRIELRIGRLEQEIMLVSINQAFVPISFVEIKAFTQLTDSLNSNTTTNYLTNLGMNAILTSTLKFRGNLQLERIDREFGDVFTFERQLMNGTLQWRPLPNFAPTLNVTEVRYRQTDEPDEVNRTYSVGVGTRFLPSVRTSFGFSRNERYTDEELRRESNRLSLSNYAQLYPDLTANWQVNYDISKELNSEENWQDTTSLNSNLKFSVLLRPKLTGLAIFRYRDVESDLASRETQQTGATLGLRYVPSAFVNMSGTYFKDVRAGQQSNQKIALNLSLLLVSSDKLNLKLFLDHFIIDQRHVDNVQVQGFWTISKNLSFSTRGNFVYSEGNGSYNFQAALQLNL
jgi:hypothetical protein